MEYIEYKNYYYRRCRVKPPWTHRCPRPPTRTATMGPWSPGTQHKQHRSDIIFFLKAKIKLRKKIWTVHVFWHIFFFFFSHLKSFPVSGFTPQGPIKTEYVSLLKKLYFNRPLILYFLWHYKGSIEMQFFL